MRMTTLKNAFTAPPSRRVAAGLAVAGLLLTAAACSSSADDASPGVAVAPTPATNTATPTTQPIATPSAPPTAAPPLSTFPQTAAARGVLDQILESHRAAGEFVGARIAVRDRTGTVTEITSGTQTVDPASPPVDPNVPWNVGSVTKTFVAVVTLQLADEGRLDLDNGIGRYFPSLAGADRITPRQLLQHTSGLHEYNDQPAVLQNLNRKWTPAELISVAEAAGRVDEPGAASHYSNTNYIVLGEIIEQVTGHSWADEVRTRIVEPLGLTGTTLVADNPPVGYKIVNGSFADATSSADPSVGGAAGGLLSTDHDLLRLATALADDRLLSPASQAAMETSVPGEDYSQFGIDHGYGLGLERYKSDTVTVEGHMGTGEAQSAFLGYDREHETAIAVATNTAVPGPQAIMAVEALTALSQNS
jgi:D-alanyl-D-alanine carboxypeptidase